MTPRLKPSASSALRRFTAAVLVVALPVMLLGSGAWAFWSPPERLDTVTAAIVNKDEPVTIDGKTVPLGRQLAAKLMGEELETNYTWILTDADDAAEGLESGEYAAVVTIPENFSRAATSSTKDASLAEQATIDVATSDRSTLADEAIADRVVNAAVELLNDEITETYLSNVFVGLNTMHDQLNDASGGATDLADGNRRLAGGATELADGSARLASGADELAHGTGELATGTEKAAEGGSELASGADELAAGATSLNAGTGELVEGAEALASGTSELSTGAARLADGTRELQNGSTRLVNSTADLPNQTQALATGASEVHSGVVQTRDAARAQGRALAQLAESCSASGADPTYCAQVQAVAEASNSAETTTQMDALVAGSAQLATGTSQLADATPPLVSGIKDLRSGATTLNQGAQDLAGGAADAANGARALSRGAHRIADGTSRLEAGSVQLQAGSGSLADGLTELDRGAGRVNSGADGLATGAGELEGGAEELASGADDAKQGADQLADGLTGALDDVPTYSKAERDKLATTVANPVSDDSDTSSLWSRTSTLALFALVALWIGAFVAFLLVPPTPADAAGSRRGAIRSGVHSFLSAAPITLMQGLLVGVVVSSAADLDMGGGAASVAACLVAAAAFTAVNQALAALWGTFGRAVSLTVLALAIAAGLVGTIPEALTTLSAILPIDSVGSALVAAMTDSGDFGSGVFAAIVWTVVAVLGVTAAIAKTRSVAPQQANHPSRLATTRKVEGL